MNTHHRTQITAMVPSGWHVKESVTLLAPDGQANVIASSEPLAPYITTDQYAAIQGELLRREFPGYRETWSGPTSVFGGWYGYFREFSWTPPDGVEVMQIQIYSVIAGRGFTATATSTVANFPHVRHTLVDALFNAVAAA